MPVGIHYLGQWGGDLNPISQAGMVIRGILPVKILIMLQKLLKG